MNTWLESVFSDGSSRFVSNPLPRMGETVTVRIRFYEDAPVKLVILRTMPNGKETFTDMRISKREKGFVYYEAELRMTEKRMPYHFYLVCEDAVYFYTQKEITTYLPDHTYDFSLIADLEQPEWVRDAVFYQIFPERFYNGDPNNDVKSGEYTQSGYPTIAMGAWDQPALHYDQGRCLDFFGGDLQGIREKIPYLKELGVTAIYLNPIFFAPSTHKYDCLDFFHVDPHFGGDEALAELCQDLHDNGMKIILDISINHTGIAHKWFNRDCIWFDKNTGAFHNPEALERKYYFFGDGNQYHGWNDVDTLPTLNYTSQELRDVIYRSENSVLQKWLRPPYSIDGWRFDVADVFARNDGVQLDRELWPQIRKAIKHVNPNAYILAEDWGDCAEHMQGDSWDSPMNYYGCGRIIRQFLGEADLFMANHPVLRQAKWKMTAEDVKSRVTAHLAKIPYAMWENQFNLFDSHDCSRVHNNPEVNREEYRGAVIFQFMLPGAASIYYGDEAEIDGYLEEVEGCRFPMPWGKPFKNGGLYQLNHIMAKTKKFHEAMRSGSFRFLSASDQVVVLARFTDQESFVGVMSTNELDVNTRIPLASVGASVPEGDKDIFDRALSWKKMDDGSICLTVPAHTAYFFRCI